MTPLSKSVSRVTRGAYPVLYTSPQRIVLTLLPGDILEFRAFGCRKRWTVPIDTAFKTAVRLAVAAELAEKRARKKKA